MNRPELAEQVPGRAELRTLHVELATRVVVRDSTAQPKKV
jgi:hypothetical protein